MLAPRLRRFLFFVCCLAPSGSLLVFAQGAPLKFGPLTLTVPPGWKSQQNPFYPDQVQILAPVSGLGQSLQVNLRTPQPITQGVREYHDQFLQRISALIPPGSPQQSGVTGKFIWTRYVMQRLQSPPGAMILYSAKTNSSLYVHIDVDATSEQLLTQNLPAIEAMMRGARLEGALAPPAASSAPPPVSAPPPAVASSAGATASAPGPATLDDYIFTTPAGWNAKRNANAIVLESPLLGTSEKCFITFLPIRPAGPDLVADAVRIFGEEWGALEMRDRDGRGGDMPPVLVRGTSGQGWDYAILKRGVGPRGSPETRLAFLLAARLNDRLAVISGLSKDPLVSACFGELQASVWPRFFYSLSFRNWAPPGDQAAAMRRRMAGVWIGGGATAADRFVFSANGRYGGASASQQYSAVNSREVLTTTTAFFGDGAYTLRGNSITLTHTNGRPAENGFIRVEQESKDGGRSWADLLYLLRTSSVNGQEYEMKYQRTQ
jgi:hypothetical protein